MCPHPAAADTIRTLIAAVPDDRLRELFLELALAALAVPAVAEPKPAPHNGRRRLRRGKGWRRGKGKHKSTAAAAPISTRSTPSDESSVGSRAKHGRLPARQTPRPPKKNKGKGVHGDGNGRSATVSPEALWQHATKLEPKQPWRAVARELGVSDGAAQLAHRNLAMPANISPAAAARIPHTVKMGSFAKFHSRFQGTTGAVAGLVPVANNSLAHAAAPWRDTPEGVLRAVA